MSESHTINSFLEQCTSEPRSLPVPRLIVEASQRKRAVVLYPAGRMACNACSSLKAEGFEVVGFGDADPTRHGQEFASLPIFDADTISKRFPEAVIFVASSLYDTVIRERLSQAGCRHVVPMPLLNRWRPKAFVSREYENARELVLDPTNYPTIKAAYNLLRDAESRRVFINKLRYLVDFDKAHLETIQSSRPIYFDGELYSLTSNEVVADCGAFTGDTFVSFINLTHGQFGRYYAFEPDRMSWERLGLQTAVYRSRVEIVHAGVSETAGELSFSNTGKGDGQLLAGKAEGAVTIKTITLDEYFSDREPPTIVKMDIEGVEAAALRGGARLIQTHAPTLAFSVYHRPSDLWTLPLLVHELNPRYSLHVRHYTREIDDTVCYTVPRGRSHSG